jgi:hypothetical protein
VAPPGTDVFVLYNGGFVGDQALLSVRFSDPIFLKKLGRFVRFLGPIFLINGINWSS